MIAELATRSDPSGLIIVICCFGIPAALLTGVRLRHGVRPTPPVFRRGGRR